MIWSASDKVIYSELWPGVIGLFRGQKLALQIVWKNLEQSISFYVEKIFSKKILLKIMVKIGVTQIGLNFSCQKKFAL